MFSSKSRARIIRILAEGNHFISSLAKKGRMNYNTAKHHVDVLEREHLVTSTVQIGTYKIIRLILNDEIKKAIIILINLLDNISIGVDKDSKDKQLA